jgi:hypothetical protein
MTKHSAEINSSLSEIRSIAAGLPHGGDIALLQQELRKLSHWTLQTLQYLGRLDDQDRPCRCCPGERDFAQQKLEREATNERM